MAASFPHQYFPNRTALISPEDFHHHVPVLTDTTSVDMESADPYIFNNINSNMVTPLMSIINVNSPVSSANSSQDHWAVPDCMHAPTLFSESEKMCLLSGFNYYYNPKNLVFEPGDEKCSGSQLVPSFSCQDNYDVSAENWGRQGIQAAQVTEEAGQQVKVGRYSVEEKKERIIRYLKKRNLRNFKKTIKLFAQYACRKTLADKRVRVRGRFAKNIEHCDQDEAIDNAVITEACQDYSHQQFSSFYCNEALQIKYNDDEWLHFQAAMNGLIHLPYISG